MVQQKAPIKESMWAAGKHPTVVAHRTLLKGADEGGVSVRPLGSSPFTIFQKRCRKHIWSGPTEGSHLGDEEGLRQNTPLSPNRTLLKGDAADGISVRPPGSKPDTFVQIYVRS
jgi:hypothetical protein